MNEKTYDIYLAAPLFSNAERKWNSELKKYLVGMGLTVFAPQDELPFNATPGRIYHTCLNGLNSSRMTIAVLEGPDADSGTSWEAGYSTAKGRPVIGIRTDFRKCEVYNVNLMLHYSLTGKYQYNDTSDNDIFWRVANAAKRILDEKPARQRKNRKEAR